MAVGGDTLILGADMLKSADYTAGRIAVLLAYNRPLAPYDLTRLYGLYGKRFGWPQPPEEGAVGGCALVLRVSCPSLLCRRPSRQLASLSTTSCTFLLS